LVVNPKFPRKGIFCGIIFNMSRVNLRIPGPTPLPPEVIQALSQPMISHRGPEYIALHTDTVEMVKQFFQTRNDLFLFMSSGTGMMEASIVNMLSPQDKVLVVTIGLFGDRFVDCAKALGLDVEVLSFPMGQAADPTKVGVASKGKKAVIITHNETSTAITNDLKAITEEVRKHGDPLFLIDSVSGMGNLDLPVDELKLDVVFTSSQKAWMTPPGLAMISVSSKAWDAYKTAKCPRYYFDFAKMKKYNDKGQTPETPAVSTIFALNAALKVMTKRGVKETFAYYSDIATYTRTKLVENGFKLFGDQSHASNTVSACYVPEGVEDKAFRGLIKSKYNVVLSGSKGEVEGKIVRVAHMGWVATTDIDEVVAAMVQARKELI
jgi:aspartate aminotransferase-like enzyme